MTATAPPPTPAAPPPLPTGASATDGGPHLTPVDRIFKRLAATYGAAWDRSLGEAPIADIKTVWANNLSGFLQSREAMRAIAWALESLPDRCPNSLEFRALCRQAPAVEQKLLEPPKADPGRVAAELSRMAPIRALVATGNPPASRRAWVGVVQGRIDRGEKVSPTVRAMAQAAGRVYLGDGVGG